MNFYERLEADAKRLEQDAESYEDGSSWVGDVQNPSQEDRDQAAAQIRETAASLRDIIKKKDDN